MNIQGGKYFVLLMFSPHEQMDFFSDANRWSNSQQAGQVKWKMFEYDFQQSIHLSFFLVY